MIHSVMATFTKDNSAGVIVLWIGKAIAISGILGSLLDWVITKWLFGNLFGFCYAFCVSLVIWNVFRCRRLICRFLFVCLSYSITRLTPISEKAEIISNSVSSMAYLSSELQLHVQKVVMAFLGATSTFLQGLNPIEALGGSHIRSNRSQYLPSTMNLEVPLIPTLWKFYNHCSGVKSRLACPVANCRNERNAIGGQT